MPVPVTTFYAALLGLVLLFLQQAVGKVRLDTNISLNDGGHKDLIVANRRHMNFVENVPFVLLMLALIELNGGSRAVLHGLGLALLSARIVHPFGLSVDRMKMPARLYGAGVTALVALVAIVYALWLVIRGGGVL